MAQQSNNPSLECDQLLAPPLQRISSGPYTGNQEFTADAPQSAFLEFTPRQPAWECCFSRDGIFLAVAFGSPDPVVRVWKYHDESSSSSSRGHTSNSSNKGHWLLHATLSGIHEKTIRSVDFAPTMSGVWILASASFDGTVAIWLHEIGERSNGSLVKTNYDDEWISPAQLEGHDTEVKCVRFNATGTLLATCGRDKTVWIWECFLPGTIGGEESPGDQFECLAVLNGHQGDVKCVRFANSHGEWGDGDEILLSASYDDTIKCWAEDAGDWYCAATLSGIHTSTIWSLTLAPSDARLVAGSDNGSVSVYKCYTRKEKQVRFPELVQPGDMSGLWKCVGKLDDLHPSSSVYCVAYAPAKVGHGRIATCGGDNRVNILREASQSSSDRPLFSTDVSAVTDHGDVNCVAWHPHDGSVLASVGDDGLVRIWNFRI
ncbi:hypothetical protein ACA910_006645 [Epithemia clementina (nom. ined.)]